MFEIMSVRSDRGARSGQEVPSLPASAQPASQPIEPTTQLAVLDSEPGAFLFGQWKNVTILAWAAKANESTVVRLRRALSRVVGSHPNGRSTISIIAEGLPLPTPEARAALIDLINENATDLACIAVVVEGRGFASSALISAHTEIRAKSARSYEMGLFRTVDEMTFWLPPLHLERTQVSLDAEELGDVVQRALDSARSRVG
jgi:hypothetical protein